MNQAQIDINLAINLVKGQCIVGWFGCRRANFVPTMLGRYPNSGGIGKVREEVTERKGPNKGGRTKTKGGEKKPKRAERGEEAEGSARINT